VGHSSLNVGYNGPFLRTFSADEMKVKRVSGILK
jgi:hypothetical protein